ncbi:hypothetical protein C1646_749991 [Rhizophagus diaphanus]|nr:hypothetical protein C1646_749991 [Rhizophagus diaphanus] [Rhizophagus sp. MUCL 43196]
MIKPKVSVSFNISSDIIEEILFFIQIDDIKTLHSCLLLNRQWCQLVIPILWKHPFYYAQKGNSKLISTILSFSNLNYDNDDDNDDGDDGRNNNSIRRNRMTFDYISMIRHLHYDFMIISIEKWYKDNINFFKNNIKIFKNNNNYSFDSFKNNNNNSFDNSFKNSNKNSFKHNNNSFKNNNDNNSYNYSNDSFKNNNNSYYNNNNYSDDSFKNHNHNNSFSFKNNNENFKIVNNNNSLNNISLIMKFLLRLFIKKSVKLNSLFILSNHVCWNNNYNLNRYMELIDPEFNDFFENLKFLYLEVYSHYPSIKFLQKFSLMVNNLEILHLRTPLLGLMRFPNNMEDIMTKNLCTLIRSQKKLKEFKLINSIKYSSLFISSLSSNDYLKNLILLNTKIDEIDPLWKILKNSFNLEIFKIINCVGLNNDLILPFYNNNINNNINFNNLNNFKKLKLIIIEKNQFIDINDELNFWVISRCKKGLNDCGLLESGRLFDPVNNIKCCK